MPINHFPLVLAYQFPEIVFLAQEGSQKLKQKNEGNVSNKKKEGYNIAGQEISWYSEEGSSFAAYLLITELWQLNVYSYFGEEVLLKLVVNIVKVPEDLFWQFEVQQDIEAREAEVVEEAEDVDDERHRLGDWEEHPRMIRHPIGPLFYFWKHFLLLLIKEQGIVEGQIIVDCVVDINLLKFVVDTLEEVISIVINSQRGSGNWRHWVLFSCGEVDVSDWILAESEYLGGGMG